jgi:hypothetical protein
VLAEILSPFPIGRFALAAFIVGAVIAAAEAGVFLFSALGRELAAAISDDGRTCVVTFTGATPL